jgi:carbon storage regulator
MLVLSRHIGEKVLIGDGITITVVGKVGRRIHLGIEAPVSASIVRGELEMLSATTCHFRPELKERSSAPRKSR